MQKEDVEEARKKNKSPKPNFIDVAVKWSAEFLIAVVDVDDGNDGLLPHGI